MAEKVEELMTCPNCGLPAGKEQYVVRPDGSHRCERCYFTNTYLDGIVNRMETGYLVTLEAFVNAIDAREQEVGNHSRRVTELALIIGNAYGIKGRDLIDLYCGSLLHDIGKIGIPDAVLLKPGPLKPEEEAIMHRHPDIGYHIISGIGYFRKAAEIVRTHHEHFDGSGYPRGLKGDSIPAGSRVFAVADAMDALTVTRPYRAASSFEEAADIIIAKSGALFDPAVVESFLAKSKDLKDYIGQIVFNIVEPQRNDLKELIE